MTKIDMSFTKDELRLLVKLSYTGHFVCERDDDSEADKKTTETLIDRLLQTALTYKVMDGIGFDTESGKHFLDDKHEDSLLEDYNEFIEESFWDELVYRLGIRDLVNAVGTGALSSMEPSERISQEEEHMERYRKEFQEHGIRRLAVGE